VFIRAFACSLLALASVAVAAPSASPPPERIKPGVRISGIRVGLLTAEPARAKVRAAFERRLRFTGEGKHWSETTQTLGASTSAGNAVTRALQAPRGARVKLRVRIDRPRLRAYVASLDKKLSRPAVNAAVVGLTGSYTPIVSEGEPGSRVDRKIMSTRITKALRKNVRHRPVPLATREVEPDVTSADIGSVIVIKRDTHQLTLFNGASAVRSFGVATGQPIYPTPLGTWSIVDMQVNPWWRPPSSDWAQGLKPIPPGPGNPLGTRWMGLSAPGVGIHATPDDASIGYSASHGCIRMHVADAEWLFNQVHIGTPVFIVAA
jgi:L,D-transpeptidase catalytic domain/Putative peptidoglycan binding domain